MIILLALQEKTLEAWNIPMLLWQIFNFILLVGVIVLLFKILKKLK